MDKKLLQLGSKALRLAAMNQEAKKYIIDNKEVFNTMKKAADRYIGGETLDETIIKVKEQNSHGFKCSIEFMGENITEEKIANKATIEFVRICTEIKKQNIHSAVALDLSHIGLAISNELCQNNLNSILAEALKNNTEVVISAEGTERTDSIIDIYKNASKNYSNVSITVQAYLHRTKDDFKDLIQESGRIRMVKGAYETPEGLSIARGNTLDEIYIDYIDQLLSSKHKCSIATHHSKIQEQVKKLIDQYSTPKEVYEFESLYGIQTEQLIALKEEGYSTKLYFVYGKEWYLYVCNRIAEYPLNLFRALSDVVS